jgi:pimeloyl-ACP methyl ester carboxylesterase
MRTRIAVDDTETGDWTLLCVHGFSDNLHTWQALRAILELKGARVIGFDLPGFGKSPLEPEFVDNYSLAAIDLVRVLASEYREEGKPLIIIGNSLGGAFTLGALFERSGNNPAVDGAILLAPATPDTRTPLFINLVRAPIYSWSEDVKRNLSPRARRVAAEWITRASLRLVLAKNNRPSRAWRDSIVESFIRPGSLDDLEQIAREALSVLHGDNPLINGMLERAEEIRVPTDVLRGSEDRVISSEECEVLAGRLPFGRYRALPGVGHCPQNEVPELCAELALAMMALPPKSADPNAS